MDQKSSRGRRRKRRMEGQEEIRQLPKRDRIPPKRTQFFEPHPLSPKATQDGAFVFLAFEDGNTAKIFNIADVLDKNEKPIHAFEDLKPGDDVLARWSDKKFYNATVEFVGNAGGQVKEKKISKNKGTAAKKFYSHPSSLDDTQQKSSFSQASPQQPSSPSQEATTAHHQSSQWSPALLSPPYLQPPPQLHSSALLCPPPLMPPPRHQSSALVPRPLPLLSSAPLLSSSLQTSPHQPPTPKTPPLLRSSLQPPLLPYTDEWSFTQPSSQMVPSPEPLHKINFLSPSQMDMTSTARHQSHVEKSPASKNQNQTAKESFIRMLYTPPNVESEDISPSEADTLSIDSSYERMEDDFKPCKNCQGEVARLKDRNLKLEDLLDTLRSDHTDALRTFLDKMDQMLPHTKPTTTRMQELYPDSGLFVSRTRLAAIHAEARKDCFRLFHLLFDELFSAEECSNAVAFGKHGKVPEGKRVLEKSKVDALLTYIMHCSTLKGWTSVEKAKIKKALINKCRQRSSKTVQIRVNNKVFTKDANVSLLGKINQELSDLIFPATGDATSPGPQQPMRN